MEAEPAFESNDRGKGSLGQYRGVLVPANDRVRIRLAGSNPYQQQLRALVESGTSPLETAIGRRSRELEAIDAPIPVRLFTGARVSDVVGTVPRGLESVIDEALSRLETAGRKARIPVELVRHRGRYRVELLVGLTR